MRDETTPPPRPPSPPDGGDEALALVEEHEHGGRVPPPWLARCIAVIAGAWSLFQLSLPVFWSRWLYDWLGWQAPDDPIRKAVHLAFALLLVFLCFPSLRAGSRLGRFCDRRRWLRFLVAKDGVPWSDLGLGLVAAGLALYFWLDYDGIAARLGSPSPLDTAVGLGLVGLVLAASWRALGPFLALVVVGFIVLVFNAEWLLPGRFAMRNMSVITFVDLMTMSTAGIYGTPLAISTRVIFLFVLFGALLARTGGGRWFTDLAFAAVGRFRGGPGMGAVLASGLTGMISGSSIANTVTTGTFTIPIMKRAGYPAVKAGAIEVAASTNGQLMPPIMGAAAFIIAANLRCEYIEVIRAAFIPAIISYLALIFITRIEALKLGLKPLPKEEIPPFWATLGRGLHFLIPMVFLVTLLLQRQSAEKAAFWAIVVLAGVSCVRSLVDRHSGLAWHERLGGTLRQFRDGLVDGGRNMMGIAVAVAAAGIIVALVNHGLGQKLIALIGTLAGGNLLVVLIFTAVVSLILGMGLPTTANYIVMAALTVPIIQQYTPSELQVPVIAMHLFCFFFGILADDTPPVGLAAYAAAAISRADPIKTGIQGFIYDLRTAILPFMFFFNHELLLVGVDSFWYGTAVFCCGTVAMFSFASATQRWFVVRCRWWEVLLLFLVTFTLLRPTLWASWLGWPRAAVLLTGLGLYGAILLMQIRTRARHRTIA